MTISVIVGARRSQQVLTSHVGTGSKSHCFDGAFRIIFEISSTVAPSKLLSGGTSLRLTVGKGALQVFVRIASTFPVKSSSI